MKVPTPPNGHGTEWFRLIMLGMNALIVPVLIWGINLEIRVSGMENNQYTATDALVESRIMDVKLSEHSAAQGHSVMIQRVSDLSDDVDRLEGLHDLR